jgi:hypothetical protein
MGQDWLVVSCAGSFNGDSKSNAGCQSGLTTLSPPMESEFFSVKVEWARHGFDLVAVWSVHAAGWQ